MEPRRERRIAIVDDSPMFVDAAARYVTEREQFGHPVAEFQGLQFMLADMVTRVEAARLLVYSACARLDAGAPGTSRASAMRFTSAAEGS